MKWFLKMAEIARTEGIHGDTNPDKEIRRIFDEAMSKGESFVFTKPPNVGFFEAEESVEAAPFESFCIEEAGDKMVYSVPLENDIKAATMAVLAIEASPDEYHFFHLVCSMAVGTGVVTPNSWAIIHEDNSQGRETSYGRSKGLANRYINLIHQGTEGVEKVKQTLKIGPKQDRQKRTIRRVIHIAAKKDQGDVVSGRGGAIDWSHRFLVRGHWRKVNGVGKNRNGDYCIQGKTFVIPHEKGQGDLVHKTRIVDTGRG